MAMADERKLEEGHCQNCQEASQSALATYGTRLVCITLNYENMRVVLYQERCLILQMLLVQSTH